MALTDNIVGYWKLDESSGNAADATGNSNTLTNNNTVTYGTAVINNGAIFNGTNQYLAIAGASQTGLATNTDITMAFWINFTSFSASTVYMPIGRGDLTTVAGRSYIVEFNVTGTNKFDLEIGDGATQTRRGVAFTPTTGTWYHLAVVYTKAGGTADFYVNGSQSGTQQSGLPTTVGTNSTPFQLGAINDSVQSYFLPGKLDEAGVWARALSGAEISQLYNGGAGLQYPFSGGGGGATRDARALTLLGVG
jgi:hypothetical protein